MFKLFRTMGKVQSSLESKVFDEVPPWDLETIVAKTDLDEATANACWRMWIEHPLVEKGQLKEEAYFKLLDIKVRSSSFQKLS